jgi:hypothetical protein
MTGTSWAPQGRPPGQAGAVNTGPGQADLAQRAQAPAAEGRLDLPDGEPAASAAEIAESARRQAEAAAAHGKDAAAGQIRGVADTLRAVAGELDSREQGPVAGYARQAAGGLEQMSAALERQSLGELAASVEDFARRQPATFLGGAVLAGFLLARFAKSSGARHAPPGRGLAEEML